MPNTNSKEQSKSWVDRAIDRVKPQPPAPKSPAPPPVDQTQWEQSVGAHKVNTLTIHDVGLIVFGETQSVTHSDKANDTIGGAREKVAHAVINGDTQFGHHRPKTTPPIEPSGKAMRDPVTNAAYVSSLGAAREAYLSPMDPTHGAMHFNLRPNADRSNFERGPHEPGFKIRTQSGPFDNSNPKTGKNGLPARGILSIRMGSSKRALFPVAGVMISCLLLVSSWGQDGSHQVSKRKTACKTPENAAICYWAHGRLSLYNGTPSFRLWKIGTHRILGIYSGPEGEKLDELDNEHPGFPASIRQLFKPLSNQIFADFEICPLEPEHTGVMQAACVESAKNIVVDP